jgi:hypothetical protein
VSPCFPPHYNIFDIIFQMYHVQFAQVGTPGEGGGRKLVNSCFLALLKHEEMPIVC